MQISFGRNRAAVGQEPDEPPPSLITCGKSGADCSRYVRSVLRFPGVIKFDQKFRLTSSFKLTRTL